MSLRDIPLFFKEPPPRFFKKHPFLRKYFLMMVSKRVQTLKTKKMKQLIFSLIVLGGFTFLGTSFTTADEVEPEKEQVTQTAGSGFTDSNGDGICDNYDGNRPGKGLGPGNGQGKGRADGKGLGKGRGLRDGSGRGQGRGYGRQLRDGSGGNCNLPAN